MWYLQYRKEQFRVPKNSHFLLELCYESHARERASCQRSCHTQQSFVFTVWLLTGKQHCLVPERVCKISTVLNFYTPMCCSQQSITYSKAAGQGADKTTPWHLAKKFLGCKKLSWTHSRPCNQNSHERNKRENLPFLRKGPTLSPLGTLMKAFPQVFVLFCFSILRNLQNVYLFLEVFLKD